MTCYEDSLWEETVSLLKKNGKSWGDVECVHIGDKRMCKETFEKYARRIAYDRGYGLNWIALDLKLYGDDFVVIRQEYDGAEWWEFIPTRAPSKYEPTEDPRELLDHLCFCKDILDAINDEQENLK